MTDSQVEVARLHELGDVVRFQLLELAREPSVDRCDWMIRSLAEASTVVRRLQTELERGDPPRR